MAVKKKTAKKATSKKKATKKATSKKKVVAKKAASKKTTSKKKVVAKKTTSKKKVVAKKAASKKTTSKKKAVAKKTTSKKKVAAKKSVTKKAPAKTAAKKRVIKKPDVAIKPPRKKSAIPKPRPPRASADQVHQFTPYKIVKGEDYMNEDQVMHFQDILNDWKQGLMQEVDRTVHHMQDEAANFPDPNDRASQESEFAMELRTRDRERKLIKKIDEALNFLDTGDYGYCEDCGIEIGIRRLEARPTANLCIDCKSLEEIRERQRS